MKKKLISLVLCLLMLAPLCNVFDVSASRAKITILPLKVEGCAASPCRVVIAEE